jgi:hypothetical protein
MESTEERIKALVHEQFSKMKMSKKYSNQARLSSRCQTIIYEQWGLGHENLWKLVDKYVEELIPLEDD